LLEDHLVHALVGGEDPHGGPPQRWVSFLSPNILSSRSHRCIPALSLL
jgi:hypothetical protein